MSVALPERVDASRMVQARRTFEGKLPIASFQRLRGSLAAVENGANVEGEASYDLEFGKDELGIAYLAVRVDADLPLTCQRTLEVFRQPVHVEQRLGLIGEESEEAALPPGYEPLLIPDGMVDPAAVIEDELILALPVVPLKPGAPLEWHDEGVEEESEPNPFAALAKLKKKKR
ncbi:MAG TPA: YceD family protein [Rhodanobacteraceae bacterium]|nr:YceD family protein [Rhodanobacteraceae bacterium]